MAAKPPEDLLLPRLSSNAVTQEQVLRSLRSHQDDTGYLNSDEIR